MKNWVGKERVGKPETALANRMVLGCLSELLGPFVTVLPGCGGREQRAAAGDTDHRPSAGTLGDLEKCGCCPCLPGSSPRGRAVYSSPKACLPVLAA